MAIFATSNNTSNSNGSPSTTTNNNSNNNAINNSNGSNSGNNNLNGNGNQPNQVADVVFLIEASAHISPYVESFKTNYIIPSIELVSSSN